MRWYNIAADTLLDARKCAFEQRRQSIFVQEHMLWSLQRRAGILLFCTFGPKEEAIFLCVGDASIPQRKHLGASKKKGKKGEQRVKDMLPPPLLSAPANVTTQASLTSQEVGLCMGVSHRRLRMQRC